MNRSGAIELNDRDSELFYLEFELSKAKLLKERLIKEQNFDHAAICRDIERFLYIKIAEKKQKKEPAWDM
jgi:hypothetical protein